METSKDDFCTCNHRESASVETGEFGFWLICNSCGKVIEDSFEYYNHYDGEDHYESDCWQ